MIPRLIAFAVIALFVIASLSFSEAKPVNAGLPLIHADFPLCVNVKPDPLLRPPLPYREGKPSNDKGVT